MRNELARNLHGSMSKRHVAAGEIGNVRGGRDVFEPYRSAGRRRPRVEHVDEARAIGQPRVAFGEGREGAR
eukprot:4436421-Prymnesium_polylepis.1